VNLYIRYTYSSVCGLPGTIGFDVDINRCSRATLGGAWRAQSPVKRGLELTRVTCIAVCLD